MELDLYVQSPTPPLWQFGYGFLQYSVRPTDDRRLDDTRPTFVKIPEGPYVELREWTSVFPVRPTLIFKVTENEEIKKEAAKFIVAAHHL